MARGGFDSRWLAQLDERVNLKRVYRQAEFVARTLTVCTFLEDALRIILEWESQRVTLEIIGYPVAVRAPLLIFSLCLQAIGALSVVTHARPGVGCLALLGWCAWHPFMYRQHKNAEFVAETLSIMGGLLILFAHLSSAIAQRKRLIDSDAGQEGDRLAAVEIRAKRLGLAGRALLVTLFLFSGWTRAHRFMSNRVYSKYELATWAMVTADAAVGLALVSVCALVVLGMRSRFCALLMAAVNFVTNLWLHPFWLYLFSETTYELPDVMGAGLGEKMSGYKLSAALYASHQRYFFFQSLSYTGALLLLVVHGPGQYSIDEPDPVELMSLTAKGRD